MANSDDISGIDDLGPGGRELWDAITTDHTTLDAAQKVQLLEACRSKDRLDKFDAVLRGDAERWMRLVKASDASPGDLEVVIDKAHAAADKSATQLKQLLAAIRLPDAVTGKRPQQRGGARGAYVRKPGAQATVTPIERARAAAGA